MKLTEENLRTCIGNNPTAPYREIAEHFGVSKQMISMRCLEWNIERRRARINEAALREWREAIRRLHQDGLADEEIAERLDRNVSTMKSQRRVMGLAPNTSRQERSRAQRREAIRKLHQDGLTDKEIAARLGGCRKAVKSQRKDMGLAPNASRSTPALQRREAIRRLHQDGLTDKEITERLGCSYTTVQRQRRDMGLSTRIEASAKRT